MKKWFCLLLALIMVLSLCACSKATQEEGEKQDIWEKQDNIERYFLYAEDNKLYRLDAEKNKSDEVMLDIPVRSVSEAIVCDDNDAMIAKITNEDTGLSGLLYLKDGSNQATYLGDNTELVRMSKDGKVVFYIEIGTEQKDLYRHDAAKKLSEKIEENVLSVSVSEDGKRGFVTSNAEAYATSYTLSYFEDGEGLQKIADEVNWANVSQDCSSVAYLKPDEEDPGSSIDATAYLWSSSGLAGKTKKKLPFTATEIVMFDEKNIYYVEAGMDAAAHYYYDGSDSHRLTTDGSYHGHKLGNYMYYYRAREEEAFVGYLVYQGKKMKTNIFACYMTGCIAFVERNSRDIYGWDDDANMYRVELNEKGKMAETPLTQNITKGYSPRLMEFYGGSLAYRDGEMLYLNGEKLAEEHESYKLSCRGDVLVYKQGDKLFLWEGGRTTAFAGNENVEVFYHAKDGKVVSWQEGYGVTVQCESMGQTKKESFGSSVSQLAQVFTWSSTKLGNIPMCCEVTGAWFQRECGSLVWRR